MAEIEISTASNQETLTVEADPQVPEGTQEVTTETTQEQDQQQQQEAQPEENTSEGTEIQSVQDEINSQTELESQLKTELSEKGIDFDEISNEYNAKGELSETTLSKLETAGYPKTAIRAYLDNLEMRAEKFANTVLSFAGTEVDFRNIQEFVRAQGNEAMDAFNGVLQTGNLAIIKAHINGLKAQMGSAYGTAKPTIMGNGTVTTSAPQGYQSQKELVKAMSDPRYYDDKVYRAEVEAKVKATDFSNL